MRKILFRGKRIDNGEWVEGYFVHCKSQFDDESGRTAEIIPHCSDRIYKGEYNSFDVFEVILETVGQYTGLTDKNGTKIFEGDILKYQINIKTAIVGKIVFLCGAFVFESEELDRECDIAFATFADDEIALPEDCIEVIGNIHDNPELLETA